jgi:hypothetical protein
MTKPLKPEDYEFSTMAYFGSDLSRNQRLAILNFLSVIAVSDLGKPISPMKVAFISQYYQDFGVTGDLFLAYLLMEGRERTVADLKSLTKDNMQDLVFATTELFNCEKGGMTEEQFAALGDWLDEMGLSQEIWVDMM